MFWEELFLLLHLLLIEKFQAQRNPPKHLASDVRVWLDTGSTDTSEVQQTLPVHFYHLLVTEKGGGANDWQLMSLVVTWFCSSTPLITTALTLAPNDITSTRIYLYWYLGLIVVQWQVVETRQPCLLMSVVAGFSIRPCFVVVLRTTSINLIYIHRMQIETDQCLLSVSPGTRTRVSGVLLLFDPTTVHVVTWT